MSIRGVLASLVDDRPVDDAAFAAAVEELFTADVSPVPAAALLVALRLTGEGPRELVAFAAALRARMRRVTAPPDAVDTCGTGGDGTGTFNVSTAAALVVAAAGLPVAKHGNRAVSGRVGSADVIEALGVRLELPPDRLASCLASVGIAFLHAPSLHPAMGTLAPIRRALGIRTIFNLVGPLANPASVRRQVIGVASAEWLRPMAESLSTLGTARAWVVHGHGGLDELSIEGPSLVCEVSDGGVREFEIDPAALGLAGAANAALAVGSVAESADRIRGVLAGATGPARDVVCLNAGAALVVGGRAPDLAEAIDVARGVIDDGTAARLLARLAAETSAGATS